MNTLILNSVTATTALATVTPPSGEALVSSRPPNFFAHMGATHLEVGDPNFHSDTPHLDVGHAGFFIPRGIAHRQELYARFGTTNIAFAQLDGADQVPPARSIPRHVEFHLECAVAIENHFAARWSGTSLSYSSDLRFSTHDLAGYTRHIFGFSDVQKRELYEHATADEALALRKNFFPEDLTEEDLTTLASTLGSTAKLRYIAWLTKLNNRGWGEDRAKTERREAKFREIIRRLSTGIECGKSEKEILVKDICDWPAYLKDLGNILMENLPVELSALLAIYSNKTICSAEGNLVSYEKNGGTKRAAIEATEVYRLYRLCAPQWGELAIATPFTCSRTTKTEEIFLEIVLENNTQLIKCFCMKLANSCGVNASLSSFTNNPAIILAKMAAQMGDDFEGRYQVRIAQANEPKTKNMKAFLKACDTLNAESVGYETDVTTRDIAEVKPVHYLLIKPKSEESLKFHLRVFSGFMNLLALEEFNDEERKILFVTLLAIDMPKVSKPDPQQTTSLLMQGHHRFTALLILAHLGIIPREWLRAIPVYQADVTTSQLIALAKRKSRSFDEQSPIEWDDLYEAA